MDMSDYKVLKRGIWITHPFTGEKVEAPLGVIISLNKKKAKALVNKVSLVSPIIIPPPPTIPTITGEEFTAIINNDELPVSTKPDDDDTPPPTIEGD